jgi:hypothetical protein
MPASLPGPSQVCSLDPDGRATPSLPPNGSGLGRARRCWFPLRLALARPFQTSLRPVLASQCAMRWLAEVVLPRASHSSQCAGSRPGSTRTQVIDQLQRSPVVPPSASSASPRWCRRSLQRARLSLLGSRERAPGAHGTFEHLRPPAGDDLSRPGPTI